MDLEDDSHRDRRRVILELLRNHRVANQLELVGLLAERGLEATQSSVSRDLRFLGIAKVAGRYVAPAPAGEGRSDLSAIVRFVLGARTAGPNLAVISTPAGGAQAVGLAIDGAGWPEVVGTLAGDDTVFVATANARDQQRFLLHLDFPREGNER
ncbi:MAG TPA: arginine repressor [Thermoanaerobaculia bacterium]|nr:arginine repressor [Thermoanaerobaculia bacterium]